MHKQYSGLLLLCCWIGAGYGQSDTAVDSVSGASNVVRAPDQPPDKDQSSAVLSIGSARLYVFYRGGTLDMDADKISAWIRSSAEVVADYYGRFPVDEASLVLTGVPGARVFGGRADGAAGAVVNVSIGQQVTSRALTDDWVLVHELIHLAFPSVSRRHNWIEEGLSVYVESIARVQAGDLNEDDVWLGFLRGMPNGLPMAGDRGLDFTPTWGRTYWGGALYCLLADVQIREQTGGKKSLRDALRAINAAGYDMTRTADLVTVLKIGDTATGVSVLQDLYARMYAAPMPVEIDSLWTELGVSEVSGRIRYDDDAPQAQIRRALIR